MFLKILVAHQLKFADLDYYFFLSLAVYSSKGFFFFSFSVCIFGEKDLRFVNAITIRYIIMEGKRPLLHVWFLFTSHLIKLLQLERCSGGSQSE